MKRTIFKKMAGIIGLCLLPYLALITYFQFTESVFLVPYYKKIILLLAGPLPLLIYGGDILFIKFGTDEIHYKSIGSLLIMVLSIAVGVYGFNKSIIYKFLFALGVLLWFWNGLLNIGLHYLTT